MSLTTLRRLSAFSFAALIVLGIAWELWLSPLRPGAWLLALKIVPLALALPGIVAGKVRTYQWWSMLILGYVAEGAVRASSDEGHAATLAAVELALSTLAFTAILLYARAMRMRGSRAPHDPSARTPDRARRSRRARASADH